MQKGIKNFWFIVETAVEIDWGEVLSNKFCVLA